MGAWGAGATWVGLLLSAPYSTTQTSERTPRLEAPSVGFELGLTFGFDGPVASSEAAFGSGVDDVGPAFSIGLTAGLDFPRDWVSVQALLDVDVGALRTEPFEETGVVPTLSGGSKMDLGLGLELRPPGLGWQPFARIHAGAAWLATNGEECARYTPDPFDEDRVRCLPQDRVPLDEVRYVGVHAGLSVGLAVRRIADVVRLPHGATVELRYTVTQWDDVAVEDRDGVRFPELVLDGELRPIGRGPPVLHQFAALVGFRLGFTSYRDSSDRLDFDD